LGVLVLPDVLGSVVDVLAGFFLRVVFLGDSLLSTTTFLGGGAAAADCCRVWT